MKTANITDIIIKDNRQRQEFDPDALQELKCSIEDNGLFHPPVLREEEGKLVLVAGERRLKVLREIFELGGQFNCDGKTYSDGVIPYTTLGELDELSAEEAELDENFRRRDLTWQEHAAAVARLHALREAQKSKQGNEYLADMAARGVEPEPATVATFKQTVADTAKELTGRSDGAFQDNVRKELIVARHLSNPAIAKAKSADEAFKLLKKDEERKKNMELAKTVGASFNAERHTALNMDCLHFMDDPANAGKFDVILTDPPYGMGADSFGDGAGRLSGIEHHYDDSVEAWQKLMTKWTRQSFVITKPQAHAYVFCDFDRFHDLKAMMEIAGWYVFRTPLIVHKLNSGRVPLPDQGPRRQYELILYAIKGKKPVTHIYPDVVAVSGDDNMSHGAQKPVALYQNLLQRSVRPGDSVVDTFSGTGTIFPAAHTYQCYATGIEVNPEYYALGLKRLQTMKSEDQLGLDLGD